MKIEFIKRGAATRLILIFAGWSTDARYYSDCTADGWDTAVVSDYRDLTMPALPEQYATVYIFAYSLGVFAASTVDVAAAARIAVCGSPLPVSDRYGIPEAIYEGTLDGLSEKSLAKFHLRMAGDRVRYSEICERLPLSPDITTLKEELVNIREASRSRHAGNVRFDRVYLAENDRIFPHTNLLSSWARQGDVPTVSLKAPHAVDMSSLIRGCLPDTAAIGAGFQRAEASYREHAVVQREICRRIVEKLEAVLPDDRRVGGDLLEIGPGQGLLTEEWSKVLKPKSVVYVDLAEVPYFGIADEETYLQTDAEEWLEKTPRKFDVILSASTMQWFADPLRFIASVRSHLNPGGIAILSTFVKGNLQELDAVRPAPILYRTAEEYAAASAEIVAEWQTTLKFRSYRELLMHLRLTGVSPVRKNYQSGANPGKGSASEARSDSRPTELTFRPLILFIAADPPSA